GADPADVRTKLAARQLGGKGGGEELVVGCLEDVGVDQRAAAHAAPGDDVEVLEGVQLEKAVGVEQEVTAPPAARPPDAAEQLAESEHTAREVAPLGRGLVCAGRTPPRAPLEHQHTEPALREARGADGTPEARADDEASGTRHDARVRRPLQRAAPESGCTPRSGAAPARCPPARRRPAAPAASGRREAHP